MNLSNAFLLLVPLLLVCAAGAAFAQPVSAPMRLAYNSDGSHLFYGERRPADPNQTWADRNLLRDTPLTVAELLAQVDEVAGTQVDTFLLCGISYQTVIYKSQIERRLGDGASDKELETSSIRIRNTVAALRHFDSLGVDPFRLLVARIRAKGMRPIATWRMQQAHIIPGDAKAAALSPFWIAHPEWRLKGSPGGEADAALDFAVKEVRERKLALIREFVVNYEFDGVQLDFQRFPLYFSRGREAEGVPLMNTLVRQVRVMLDEEGARRGVRLTLSVRVPETLTRCRDLGLDPTAWVNNGWVDSVVVTTFLYQNASKQGIPHFKPEYDRFRRTFTRPVQLLGSIQFIYSVPAQGARREYRLGPPDYRREAAEMWKAGVDGVEVFNFFMPRAYRDARGDRSEPPFFVLKELGDPSTIGRGDADVEEAWWKANPLEPIPRAVIESRW